MMVHNYECDSPSCKALGTPENVEDLPKKKPIAPYGWWTSSTSCMGPGTKAEVITCSVKCIASALTDAINSEFD